MFAGTGFMLGPTRILCDQTGSGKIASRKSPETSDFRRGLTGARPAIEGRGGRHGGWGPIQLTIAEQL